MKGADGSPWRWRETRGDGVLSLRIGDPDAVVSGVREFRIRYRVRRGILYFGDHDELYWNATGNDWPVPIARASATLFLPREGIAGVRGLCFTGVQGAVESACSQRETPGALWVETQRPLAQREGLSVTLWLPKGVLQEPSRAEKLLDRASDYLGPWLALPLVVFTAMFGIWRTQGRDPVIGAAVAVRYEPPAGLAPAEIGALLDERVDSVDITATLLDLAVRGVLRFEESEEAGGLLSSERELTLVKLRELTDGRPHERLLLELLFARGARVTLASLKNSFHQHLPQLRRAIGDAVSREQGLFPAAPESVKRGWTVTGAVAIGLGMLWLHLAWNSPAAIAVAVSGAIVAVFGRAMPRRTLRGRRAYEELLGFKEFLERVDRDRLERLGTRTRESFEKWMPIALVLGVADAWADAFADLYREPPSWYTSPRYGHGFQPRMFVRDVDRSLQSLGSAMASAPRGSGASGFGGGGSSGGGFGGGGGRSW